MMQENIKLENDQTNYIGRWWHRISNDRIQCDLCPRFCQLKVGQKGFCYVREATTDGIALTTYGKSSGFGIDPIEKKPLNHFYPGSSILSFGTAGCNLGCKFCQNWDISKARSFDRLAQEASPKEIASWAKDRQTHVAFTYNDPVIFAEYAIDVAKECRKLDVKTVAVTAGYMTKAPREEFYQWIDAANIDLKGFDEKFYRDVCFGELNAVLETIEYVAKQTQTWLELTTLIIPTYNDSDEKIRKQCEWIIKNCGENTPLHFSAFHPDFKMLEIPSTPHLTLLRAKKIAEEVGLKYVYVGNVHDTANSSTYCEKCKNILIERDWFKILQLNLKQGCCQFCGQNIPGRFLN